MEVALCTLMDDRFFIGFVGFWKSFIRFNPWFKHDFVVLDNGISKENKIIMKSMCNSIIFRKVKKKNYSETNFSNTHERLKATYYTLDVFSLYEYERVVFVDMDITVLGDISELFKSEAPIRGCKAYNARLDELGEGINSGVFTINKKVINKETYTNLIRLSRRGQSMPDQKIINSYFRNKMEFFNKSYNVEKRMLHSVNYKDIFDNAKILHWIADKPWEDKKSNDIERSFIELEKVWWEYYNK